MAKSKSESVSPSNPSKEEFTIKEQSTNEIAFEDFLENFKSSDDFKKMIVPRSTKLSELQAEEVLTKFAEKHKLTRNETLLVITLLFQTGGTNRSCDGNLTVTVFSKEIRLASLRKTLVECKLKASERKLARTLGTQIFQISKELEIPGNLAKKITREFPERKFSTTELAWLSEFQVDNPECPEESRKLITESFKNRTGNKNKNKK